MSFTGVDGDEISGTDIDFAELGLGDIVSGNVKIAGFSANRGTEDEAVLVRVDAPGTQVFVVVVGSNEAYSLTPYSLQIETSVPFDQAVLAADLDPELYPELAAICGGEPRVQGSYPLTMLKGDSALDGDAAPLTLIVTQRDRIISMYGQTAWDGTMAKLTELADHQAIDGKIISLPSSIYDAWDTDTCSVPNANAVSDAIRTEILSQLDANESIRYVVLVGSDDIVPFRRVPDETTISSERFYLMGSFLKAGSPLFASIQQGYNLTDDFYADIQPSPWQGRALYVPDRAIGRLVETPGEIQAAAQAFLDSNGQLNPATGFVSGYDFFTDGSQTMADELSTRLSTTTLINDSWSIENLRCQYLGVGVGDPTCVVSGVNAVNAHYTHYAAVSAGGYNGANGLDPTDYISSAEVAGSPESLAGTIVYTMGCHAGLNVPDWSAISADPGLGIDPAMDFVQAMAVQRAIYIASTGYGLGDDEGLGGTERLLAIFSGELVQGDVAAGGALVAAKQRYLNSLSAMTVYDEKSSIQTTFYGLPQYAVLPRAVESAAQTAEQASSDIVQITPSLIQVNTEDGSYFTADGDAQSTAGRPIQPRVVIDLLTTPMDGLVHGALLLDSTFQDIESFDPVITRPTTEWESDTVEPQTCLPSYWPSELATINSLETADGLIQSLVVVPGQFRCTSDEAPPVTGIQRVYGSTTLELQRSTSDDFDEPSISGLDIRAAQSGGVDLKVDASDPGGIDRVVVLQINPTTGEISMVADVTTSDPFAGSFIVNIPGPGDDALLIQVVDAAGNVASATGKGANLSVITVVTEPEVSVNENTVLWLTATVADFGTLTPPVSYTWEFGDGIFATGQTADGLISVSHVYPDDDPSGSPSDQYETALKVTDASGGIGNAAATVTVYNVVPVVDAGPDRSVDEGEILSLVETIFYDQGVKDTHTSSWATIDWDDGTPIEGRTIGVRPCTTLGFPPAGFPDGACGAVSFGSHVYADNGVYTVTVTVTDDDLGVGNDTVLVTVNNVAPTLVAGPDQSVNEGGVVTLAPATFNDLGTLDTHTATVNWGDGTLTEAGVVDETPFGPPGSTAGADGTTSGSHVYADDGVYTVTVTVTDDDGGTAADTLAVTINNVAPTLVAGPDQLVDEGGIVTLAPATFNDLGTLDTHTATINWGDGTPTEVGVVSEVPFGPPGSTAGADGTTSGNHVYADDGVYTVTVTVADDDGGTATDTLAVTVGNVTPTVDAGPDQTTNEGSVVSLAPAAFNDLGTLDTHTATINWGDGTADTGVVSESPSGPPGSTAGADGAISASHVYADDGIYTVTVTVTDDDGGVGSDTLAVTVGNVAPTMDASPDQTTDEGSVVSLAPAAFNDLGTLDTHTATINWGDGTVTEAGVVGETPSGPPGSTTGANGTISGSHVYADDGIYTVTMTVTDDDGGTVTDTLAVTINNIAPTVDAGFDQNAPEGSVVSLAPAAFNDLGTLDTHAATIDWDDGTVTEAGVVGEAPYGPPGSTAGANGTISGSHVYADNGTYIVTVTLTDDNGGVGADTLLVTVNNIAPTVNAGLDKTVTEGNLVSLAPATFNDLGTLDTHTATVDWGDGTSADAGAVTETPTGPPGSVLGTDGQVFGGHIYADDGAYTVTVSVTDDDGDTTVDTLVITVGNNASIVNAGPDQTANEGSVVSLAPAAFNDLGTLDTHTATINWGDGTADTGVVSESPSGPPGSTAGADGAISASHVYADDGVYTVIVTVTDDNAGVGTDTLLITVGNVAPTVDAGPDQTTDEGSVVSLAPAAFNDLGTLDTHTAIIDWGDGTVGMGVVSESPSGPPGSTAGADGAISASHVYADDGVYTVIVTVADGNAGVGADTLLVTVGNVAPTVDAGLDKAVTEGNLVSLTPAVFNDLGTLDIHTATIDWGDGTADVGIVSESPSGPPGSTAGADGTISGSHVYADDGVYTVTVTVTDDNGGYGSDTLLVTVGNVAPTVDAGLDKMATEGDLVSLTPAVFNDLGTLDIHTATIDWGDSTAADVGAVTETPFGPPGSTAGADGSIFGSHVYGDDGVYTVTVTVTDDDGSSATDTLDITVNEQPDVCDNLDNDLDGSLDEDCVISNPTNIGASQLVNVNINGQGPVATVGPGVTLSITGNTYLTPSPYCPGCVRQLYIGIAANPVTGTSSQGSSCFNGATSRSYGASFTAPTAEGTYYVVGKVNLDYNCYGGFWGGTVVGKIVVDATPPVLTLPVNINTDLTSAAGAEVTYTASATDAVDGDRPVTCSTPSGATFPAGTTVVTCEAGDLSGNTASGSFSVTVNVPPDGCDNLNNDFDGSLDEDCVISNPTNIGASQLVNVNVNGQGPVATVGPGATLSITGNTYLAPSPYCPGCVRQLYVGIAVNPVTGTSSQGSSCFNNATNRSYSTGFTAPTAEGTYYVVARVNLDYVCYGGFWGGTPVGKIVVDGE